MRNNATVLVVDDEADIRFLVSGILEDEGYNIIEAATTDEAYDALQSHTPSLAILDIWLGESENDGLQILDYIMQTWPHMPALMISGHGTIETAVSAIKKGAYDFIEKPFKSDRLAVMVHRAFEAAQLRDENRRLRERVSEHNSTLLGESTPMQQLKHVIGRVAPTNSRVLITGEPGSGKEVVARQIHNQSHRAQAPFFVLNCAVMRPDRLETELFGAEAGIEGDDVHPGVLEQASGGTLLLDEVGDMPLETQSKIVRVLQDQSFHRVGGQEALQADVRILASTNQDLHEAMARGEFRQDLFYRLSVVPVDVPALRERESDIPLLARHFMQEFAQANGHRPREFSQSALVAMQAYTWPGNVRQLRNLVEWLIIMGEADNDQPIHAEDLPADFGEGEKQDDINHRSQHLTNMPLRQAREAFERDYLLAQMQRFDWNISKTAEFIGMERSALHRKLKSLNIEGEETAQSGHQNSKISA